jgi:hypothetical protein
MKNLRKFRSEGFNPFYSVKSFKLFLKLTDIGLRNKKDQKNSKFTGSGHPLLCGAARSAVTHGGAKIPQGTRVLGQPRWEA